MNIDTRKKNTRIINVDILFPPRKRQNHSDIILVSLVPLHSIRILHNHSNCFPYVDITTSLDSRGICVSLKSAMGSTIARYRHGGPVATHNCTLIESIRPSRNSMNRFEAENSR